MHAEGAMPVLARIRAHEASEDFTESSERGLAPLVRLRLSEIRAIEPGD
jgi:hypothetical protein